MGVGPGCEHNAMDLAIYEQIVNWNILVRTIDAWCFERYYTIAATVVVCAHILFYSKLSRAHMR